MEEQLTVAPTKIVKHCEKCNLKFNYLKIN